MLEDRVELVVLRGCLVTGGVGELLVVGVDHHAQVVHHPDRRRHAAPCQARYGAAVSSDQKNLLGQLLEPCSMAPRTGFFRTGCCETDASDRGHHVVCAEMTAEFLAFSASRGNDLSTPGPGFPGLKPGDRWCLCAARWKEALDAGKAPPVHLAATHESATDVIEREALLRHAADSQSLN